jgi:Fe-S oxidoreductase
MFKEAEHGNKEVNVERTEDVLETGADIVAVNCPFCSTMLKDGTKHFDKEDQIEVLDIAEMVQQSMVK